MKKITNIELTNFRGHSNLRIDNIDNLLVIVGKNDIGKTSIIKALDIYCNTKSPMRLVHENDFHVSEDGTRSSSLSIKVDGDELEARISGNDTQISKNPGKQIPLKYFPVEYSDEYNKFQDKNSSLQKIKEDIDSHVKRYYTENDASSLRLNLELLFKLLEDQKKLTELVEQLPKELQDRFYDPKKMNESVTMEQELIEQNPDYKDQIVEVISVFKEYDTTNDIKRLVDLGILREQLDYIDYESRILPPSAYRNNQNKEEIERLNLTCFYKSNLMSSELYPQPVMEFIDSIKGETDIFQTAQGKYGRIIAAFQHKEETLQLADEYIREKTKEPEIVHLAKEMIGSFQDSEHINIGSRGSGVQRLAYLYYNILLSRISYLNRNIIIAIDEPEMSLHPQQQRILTDALKEMSKYNQIIITTHSPYIVKRCEEKNVLVITPNGAESLQDKRCIKSYFSLNEVNYIAFDEPSVEYHIELFGYIQNKLVEKYNDNNFKTDWDSTKPNNPPTTIRGIDLWLKERRNPQCNYYRTNRNPYELTTSSMSCCVRNNTDHPLLVDVTSNSVKHNAYVNNMKFSDIKMITKSIILLRKVIKTKKLKKIFSI